MTTPNLEQIIADHSPESVDSSRFSGYVGYCRCRFSVSAPTYDEVRRSHAAHVVAAIRDSGLTVIALPEADGTDKWNNTTWLNVITAYRGYAQIHLGNDHEVINWTPSMLRHLGASLLAAAQVAERNNP